MIKITKRERGFTLIELLVVIAIIGVLAAAGTVGYQSYTANARSGVAESNHGAVVQFIRTTVQADAAGIDPTFGTLNGDCFGATVVQATCEAEMIDKFQNDGFKTTDTTPTPAVPTPFISGGAAAATGTNTTYITGSTTLGTFTVTTVLEGGGTLTANITQ